jgi:hypothetical protein
VSEDKNEIVPTWELEKAHDATEYEKAHNVLRFAGKDLPETDLYSKLEVLENRLQRALRFVKLSLVDDDAAGRYGLDELVTEHAAFHATDWSVDCGCCCICHCWDDDDYEDEDDAEDNEDDTEQDEEDAEEVSKPGMQQASLPPSACP